MRLVQDKVTEMVPTTVDRFGLVLTVEEAQVLRGLVYTFFGNVSSRESLRRAVEDETRHRGPSKWDGPSGVQAYHDLFAKLWDAFNDLHPWRP